MPRLFLLALSLLASLSLSGCTLVTGIFKAGEWVGALVVAVIVIGAVAVVTLVRRRR